MLKLVHDMDARKEHHIKVEKLPDGRYRATEYVLGPDVIAPAEGKTHSEAWTTITNRCNRFDETGEPQK